MGTGDGQDRGPSASGAPEPLLTKLRTSGTLGAEAEQKQAVDGRHSRQKVAERAKGTGQLERLQCRIPGHCRDLRAEVRRSLLGAPIGVRRAHFVGLCQALKRLG